MRSALSRLLQARRTREHAAIRHFLCEAYLDHEITPGDFRFLLDKLDKLS